MLGLKLGSEIGIDKFKHNHNSIAYIHVYIYIFISIYIFFPYNHGCISTHNWKLHLYFLRSPIYTYIYISIYVYVVTHIYIYLLYIYICICLIFLFLCLGICSQHSVFTVLELCNKKKNPLPGDSPMMKMSPTVMEQWVTRLYPHSHLPPGPGGAKVG